ncbi:unnamed protein product [Cochlearia groenlandica]
MDSPSPFSDGSRWSKLPLDLLHMVLERLSFADFHRAKSVCSSWLYASKQTSPTDQTPWLIRAYPLLINFMNFSVGDGLIFPEKGKTYFFLCNPEKNNKMYIVRDLGANFTNSYCLATYGSWLFMRDPQYNLYIMNLFTRERINLPSVESEIGMVEIKRTINDMFRVSGVTSSETNFEYHENRIIMDSPLFWIDEKTKNYVVIWKFQYIHMLLVYSKKGDIFWKQTEVICRDVKMGHPTHFNP